MIKHFLLLVLWIGSLASTTGQKPISAHHILLDAPISNRVQLRDSVLFQYDTTGTVDVSSLIIESQDFSLFDTLRKPFPKSYYSWAAMNLTNRQQETANIGLDFPAYIDTVWVYEVKDGQLISTYLTGKRIKSSKKLLAGSLNFVPISIDPNENKTLFIKASQKSYKNLIFKLRLSLVDTKSYMRGHFNRMVWNSFYVGVMLLFGLISAFLYFLFREISLVYFSLLMIIYAAKYAATSGLADALFLNGLGNEYFEIYQILESLHLVVMFLFITSYIAIKKHFPKYYQIVLVLVLAISLFFPVSKFFAPYSPLFYRINSVLLLIVNVLGLIPILLLTKRGDKSSKVILISLSILFISAILHNIGSEFKIYIQLSELVYQVGTILFAGFLFYSLFSKIDAIRLETAQYAELNEMKSRFFANISHEFRTPLTLIMGPIRILMEKSSNNESQVLLKTALDNSNRLLQLINQILDLSRLESKKIALSYSQVNLLPVLKGLFMSFESIANIRSISLNFESHVDELILNLDREKIDRVFINLLSNAIKFTPSGGSISLIINETNHMAIIKIKDSGIGISKDNIPFIFDRFYQVDDGDTRSYEGSGIGLALVKELVLLHSGEISVESNVGMGTTFTVCLPKGKAHLDTRQLRSDIIENSGNTTSSEKIIDLNIEELDTPFDQEGRKTILIIEDNLDVRNLIVRELYDRYNILEAEDGETGLENAFNNMPDLIISDVMMPKMNGYDVCSKLKVDFRTSHIPVILLTAKAEREDRLKGFSIGVDDYLIKPFDPLELKLRVENLIELRAKLLHRYTLEIEAQEINKLNPVDEAFLKNINKTIELNLTNVQFSVETLAMSVSLSSRHLSRKLKAISNMSASQYIQNFRLEHAYKLLLIQDHNVSEVAYHSGFSSPAYFIKCFKEKYNTTPGEILNK